MLKRLAKIPDPRNPKKTKHKMASLFIYGILMFVFQFSSRREVNREMSRPQFKASLKKIFPELEKIPHADTLYRLLAGVEDINKLEEVYQEMVKRLIRKKKFRRYLIDGCYPVCFDGSQKLTSDHLWDGQLLQRRVGKTLTPEELAEGQTQELQYYVYVLEASMCFANGMVIPFFTEFLEYDANNVNENKQDCELRAFHRLADRIKKLFPRLPIMILLDGLYANGPVMKKCHQYHWQYMIVLKNGSLTTVWEEIHGLKPLHPENRHQRTWGNRHQDFWWVNNIRYETSPNGKTFLTLHVVGCDETWEAVNELGEIETKTGNGHVWLSSRPLKASNLHERCNLGARHRWGIEANFLVEKHQGYSYEHCFATDWNAMKGYHFLMKIGHCLNVLARFSEQMSEAFATMGVRPLLRFIRETYAAPWLIPEQVRERLARKFQLRLE